MAVPFVCRASYRDLLGTAETIVEMNRRMRHIETNLGDMSRRCNARMLEKKALNLHDLEGEMATAGAYILGG